MTTRKKTIYRVLPYLLFFLFHFIFLNINSAEWGDSYRILRASEFIRSGVYPEDEKRPPLFSLVLSIHPNNVDVILWSRIVMLVISLLCLIIYEQLLNHYVKDSRYVFLGMLLFIVNPVFLYWSVRIMADSFFALLVLASFYLYAKKKSHISFRSSFLVGLVTGLAILTRFEGYLLLASLAGAILLNGINWKRPFSKLKGRVRELVPFLLAVLLIVVPWIIYRNPFSSKYFEEPSGRVYDFKMVWTYLVTLITLLGIFPFVSLLFTQLKSYRRFFINNLHLAFFTVSELLLILLWPAAIPRLFVPLIPLLIIPTITALMDFWQEKPDLKKQLILFVLILIFYFVSQYFLKLQFLVLSKSVFFMIVIFQIVIFLATIQKKFLILTSLSFFVLFLWSSTVIKSHKDIFISVKSSAEYIRDNISGVVAYNDVSSVSDFYINVLNSPKVSGFYYNTESKKSMSYDALEKTGADYLLITNEHNTSMELDIESRPYLRLVKEFKYNVNGEEFFAKIIKIVKEQ